MAIKTFAQIRQEVAENLGILDVNGNDAFDGTTSPSLVRVNQYINDTMREVVSDFPYANLERSCFIPFYHTIHYVPSASLSGTTVSGASTGIVTPFPDASALQAGCVTLPPNYSYSGISFTNISGATSISTSGSATTADWNGVGYSYELPYGVDSILSVSIPQNGIKLSYVPMYDLTRVYPQGIWATSGTCPVNYTEMPALSDNGNKTIAFFPMPDSSLSGTNFLVYFKQKQTDLVLDADTQTIVPDQFQDIIVHGALEHCYTLINDGDKMNLHRAQKQARLMNLRKWSENQPDYVNRFRDGASLGNGSFATGVDLATGYMINGFGN